MPQTGPRPVYKAPLVSPAAASAAAAAPGVIQRGKPIFDRRPTGAPGQGGYPQRTQGAPTPFGAGPRPKHPTRSAPGSFQPGAGGPGGPGGRPGFGQRPGFGAPRPGGFGPRPGGFGGPGGTAPPSGEAPRPARGPAARGRGRGGQQYPKTKEGPMKGFVPPPRFGGAAQLRTEPVPISREITVTEGISVKDLAEKLEIRAKDLIATLLMSGDFRHREPVPGRGDGEGCRGQIRCWSYRDQLRRGSGESGHRRSSSKHRIRANSKFRARRW